MSPTMMAHAVALRMAMGLSLAKKATWSVQSPITRGMPVEVLSAIRTASQSGLFSRGGR
jgi:hypothetical protein